MSSLFRHQEKILTERNIDCMLGEFKTTLLLLLQAPIIAALIAWRFHDIKATDFLYFSLSLSALWFGCTNAAREIVKESSIITRERLFGLRIGAYLVAKIKVLGLLGLLQSMCLILVVNYHVALPGLLGFHLLTAWVTTLAGIALGLLLSTLVRSIHQADALVPLILIPQILFSPIIIPSKLLTGWAIYFERFLPLGWSYKAFQQLAAAKQNHWLYLKDLGILLSMILLLFAVTALLLKRKKLEI